MPSEANMTTTVRIAPSILAADLGRLAEVASILEASRGEKLRFERAWIIRASKGARTLADVQRNVQRALETAKGMNADVYLTLDAYLEAVVPQIATVAWAPAVVLQPGVNAMDLTGLTVEMQHLVIKSTLDWVLAREEHTVVVIPEAWKFIPQGRGTPVKLAAPARPVKSGATSVYIVKLKDPGAASYGSASIYSAGRSAAQSASAQRAARAAFAERLEQTHDRLLADVGARSAKIYSYRYALNGFAAKLTATEASRLAQQRPEIRRQEAMGAANRAEQQRRP